MTKYILHLSAQELYSVSSSVPLGSTFFTHTNLLPTLQLFSCKVNNISVSLTQIYLWLSATISALPDTYYREVLMLHTNWQAGVCATCGAFRDRRGVERRSEGESNIHILQYTHEVIRWRTECDWNAEKENDPRGIIMVSMLNMSTPNSQFQAEYSCNTEPYSQWAMSYRRVNLCYEKHARFVNL